MNVVRKLAKRTLAKVLNWIGPQVAFTSERFSWSGIKTEKFVTGLIKKGYSPLAIPPVPINQPLQDAGSFMDMPLLSKVWAYSALCELNIFTDEFDANNSEHRAVAEKWSAVANAELLRISALLDKERVSACVTFQGYFLQDALLRSEAIRRGIRLINFEITARNDRIIWDDVSGITTTRNLARNYYWRHESFIKESVAEEYFLEWLGIFKSKKGIDHSAPVTSFKQTRDRPLVVFLGQVYTDSSLLFSLQGFNNPVDVIKTVNDACSENGWDLFIKLHPKEFNRAEPVTAKPYNKVTLRKLKERHPEVLLQTNRDVTIDSENEWDTYSVIEQADLVVTVNSQAGLEAAVMGKPVVVHRNCFYGGLGFTKEYSEGGELHYQLNQAIDARNSKFETKLARKFLYCFYEHYCLPKDVDSVIQKICSTNR